MKCSRIVLVVGLLAILVLTHAQDESGSEEPEEAQTDENEQEPTDEDEPAPTDEYEHEQPDENDHPHHQHHHSGHGKPPDRIPVFNRGFSLDTGK